MFEVAPGCPAKIVEVSFPVPASGFNQPSSTWVAMLGTGLLGIPASARMTTDECEPVKSALAEGRAAAAATPPPIPTSLRKVLRSIGFIDVLLVGSAQVREA